MRTFSLVEFLANQGIKNEKLCHLTLFLFIGCVFPSTLFINFDFSCSPWTRTMQNQINRGSVVRQSGLIPDFSRVSYFDPKPCESFNRYCQVQNGLAPLFLLLDDWHEYLLINASERPKELPDGYRVLRDFGHGLLILKKV